MKKIIIGGVVVALVGVVVALFYISNNLNSLVVQAVETFGKPVTQTEVKLESSDISFLSGEGSLHGLFIGNPAGYKGRSAFELGTLAVALDAETIADDIVVIKSIDIKAPIVTYEPGGAAGSNLQQLMNNVDAYIAKASGGQSKTASAEQGQTQQEGGSKIVINRVTLSGGKIRIVTPLSSEGLTVPLPKIELTDLGKDKGGISAADAFKMVMEKVLAASSGAVAGPLADIKGQLKEQVDKQVSDITSKVEDATKGLPGGLDQKAGDLGNKLKGLF
ncbi:MAG: hypothetical protein L3J26_05015 [Candidatus Polarisedimenticolaceae bacterium]|nr:hypothetical protein [Candidatus Polarisedimenticolaceae bacterium]